MLLLLELKIIDSIFFLLIFLFSNLGLVLVWYYTWLLQIVTQYDTVSYICYISHDNIISYSYMIIYYIEYHVRY